MKHYNRKILKRVVALALAALVVLPTIAFAAFPQSTLRGDGFALTDPVANTYTGRTQASRLVSQLQFTDLPSDNAAQDAIIRGSAIEVFRPDTRQFRPDYAVTRGEAITYALRAAGLSERAREIGQDNAGSSLLMLLRIWERFGLLVIYSLQPTLA